MDLECYNNSPSFIFYVEAEVSYEGRASSTLACGNYLIIKKQDNSLMVHGANHIPALNYMSSGSIIQIKGNIISATRRSETIEIVIYSCHYHLPLEDWSESRIQIKKTEAELTDKIMSDPVKYLPPGDYTVYREYPTIAGPVDLVLVSVDAVYVIEVKRRKITLKDFYQLLRYLDAIAREPRKVGCSPQFNSNCVIGCLAGPAISVNALDYCDENNLKYLRVLFEEETP